MLSRIFEKDLNTKSFGEASELSYMDPPRKLRFRSTSEVNHVLEKVRAPLIVMKPLVESQNTAALLMQYENSKALWLYRHFKDVASSNISRFGEANSISDLRFIVDDHPDNWRSEKISNESRELVKKYFSTAMSPHDAAVLFWIVRNRIFFEAELHRNPDVLLCNYEDLTRKPASVMRRIYDFAGQEYPGDQIVSGTHTKSISKGAEINLTRAIEKIATELFERMER